MVLETVNVFAEASVKKVNFFNKSIVRYFLLSALAGVYVGLAIILIFSIGGPLAESGSPALKALMGSSFAVALILVIFAGSELFTGNNMILTIGGLTKKASWINVIKLWVVCYLGNLVGALVLSGLIAGAGMFGTKEGIEPLIVKVAEAKGSAPFIALFIKGILCNLLVCLAIWSSTRTKSDMAKLTLIFWCLFAFIGSGYEHSIANMTVIGIGALVSDTVTWQHFWYNLFSVTLGNMVGGIGLAVTYWFISNKDHAEA